MEFAKKSDILLLVALVLICLLLWGMFSTVSNSDDAKSGDPATRYAEIYYKKELVKRVSLNTDHDYTFSLDEKPQVVFRVYATGEIAFVESDCPDKDCIEFKKISRPGQFAACLPNSLILTIVSEGDVTSDDIDIHIK